MNVTFDDKRERALTLLFLLVAMAALALGGLVGLFQALEHAQINLYPLPLLGTYYQALTLHGVLNALTWTTFFISGFLMIAQTASLKRRSYVWLSWLGFAIMLVGLAMAAYTIFTGNASVLYTFYVPMKANATYYIGLTVLVVGTWVHSANFFLTYRAWRKDNPGIRTPMATVGTLTTWIVWDIASIGVAVEMLTMVIPWSLGLIQDTNPLLARTLFWYFAHPLVYFWLLPAYVSWYAMIPRQAGGKLFSDPLTRLAFMLFMVFSTAIGLQNQFTDPGISSLSKTIQGALSFVVTLPSFLTAFTLMASLEYSGRQRGSKSLFGWIFRLPWGDPSFTAQVFAMLIFAAGGISGVISASYDMNLVVNNTTWVAGQFHLTVGTAVTLTFMGVTYWLLPYLTKRKLFSRLMALGQAWTWFIGMILFGQGMNWAGLLGAPRRTPFSQATYTQVLINGTKTDLLGGTSAFQAAMALVAIGGVILFISGGLYFINVIGTLLNRKDSAMEVEVPLAESLSGPENSPAALDNWRLWIGLAIFFVLLSYGPAFIQILSGSAWNAPGLIIK
jgi:cytochrome c oxidase subunit I